MSKVRFIFKEAVNVGLIAFYCNGKRYSKRVESERRTDINVYLYYMM